MIAEETAEVAPAVELTERLRLYSRYLALVAEQLDAVSADDGPRIAELEEERLALEAELAAPETEVDAGSVAEALGLALQALKDRVDMARLLEERWTMLSTEALQSARVVPRPVIPGGRYGDAHALECTLDRRL